MTSANIESVITETLSATDEISGDRGIQHSDFFIYSPVLNACGFLNGNLACLCSQKTY